jgi:hypothetical protein
VILEWLFYCGAQCGMTPRETATTVDELIDDVVIPTADIVEIADPGTELFLEPTKCALLVLDATTAAAAATS